MNGERKFMELAILEARKCNAEPGRQDAPPLVGVVVVKDGEILDKAHRGELGSGEHAEYTVLERKLHDKSVVRATVYCTLEPCTTRNHPKVPCAEWLVSRKVSRVVVGMLDPNPTIRGLGEQRLRDAGIDVQRFPKDLADQVEELNRRFIREQKAKVIHQPARPQHPTDDATPGNDADYPQPTRADCEAALKIVERILQHVEILFRFAEPHAHLSKEGLESFADQVVELGQECWRAYDVIPKVTFLLPQTLNLRVLGIAATTYHELAWVFGLEILDRINRVIGGYQRSHRVPTKEQCLAESEKALRELMRIKMDLMDFDVPIRTCAIGEFRHAVATLASGKIGHRSDRP